MVQKISLLLLSCWSIWSFAAPQSKAELCQNYHNDEMQARLLKQENQLAFVNLPGIINNGICFWHSRFTRNAAALAYFSPEKAKPQSFPHARKTKGPFGPKQRSQKYIVEDSVEDIVDKIAFGREIVEIPGFNNLNEFSKYFARPIYQRIMMWQLTESIFTQRILMLAAKGSYFTTPNEMQEIMDKLYAEVRQGTPVFQILQHKGFSEVHSWLVLDMRPTATGYILKVLDSDFLGVQTHEYKTGEDHLEHPTRGDFVPYTAYDFELSRLQKLMNKRCK